MFTDVVETDHREVQLPHLQTVNLRLFLSKQWQLVRNTINNLRVRFIKKSTIKVISFTLEKSFCV